MDFDATADELYGLPPSEFTAARDARASEASAEGDRQTAAALKKLRRPSTGAWLANQVVRCHPESVDHLLAVAAALREAQTKLDGGEMRRLSAEGRDAVVAMVKEASEISRTRGEVVSEASRKDLEATLDAALADPEAAAALRAGRLTAGLRYSGLGLADAMAQSSPGVSMGGESRTNRRRARERASEELERARDQLQNAESAVAAAESTLAERKDVAERAARRVREAENAVRDLDGPSGTRKSPRR